MIKWDSGGHMTWPYNQWAISEGGHWLTGTQDQSGLILSGPVLVLQFLEVFRTSPVLVLSKIGHTTGQFPPQSSLPHWQWLRYALNLLISSLLTYCTSLGTYCPLSSLCYSETIGPQPATLEKRVQGMGCTWTCARMWFQSVATSLFTSHRKEATCNCSPVASLSEKLQLDFKTLDSGKFSIRLWVHEYHTWINWAIQQSKSHLAWQIHSTQVGCHRWFFHQLGGQQTNPTPLPPTIFPLESIVGDLGILNYGGFTPPQMPSPGVLLGATGSLVGMWGCALHKQHWNGWVVSSPKQHLTG